MRLIDADRLNDTLIPILNNYGNMELAERILYHVNHQPTAYDIDKVVKNLKKEAVYINIETDLKFVELNESIEIVKAGEQE